LVIEPPRDSVVKEPVPLCLPWALGGYEYSGSSNQVFRGFIGDVRIVDRPSPVDEFMIAFWRGPTGLRVRARRPGDP
jgi:hypothetical protein